MRVDAHHHVWDLAVRDQPWTAGIPELRRSFTLTEIEADMSPARIDATVVVQTLSEPADTADLLALVGPMVRGVVGWVDLTAPDVADVLAGLQEGVGGSALVGIRHLVQQEPDPRWLCRTDVWRGLKAVAAAGLVYDVVVQPNQLPAVIDTVAALPELRFVLDHGGSPAVAAGMQESWASDLRTVAHVPNVAVKLSGLVTEADHETWTPNDLTPYVDVLLSAFGPDRTMYGSDWPACLVAATYAEVFAAAEFATAALGSAERAQVFGGTAARWYGLSL